MMTKEEYKKSIIKLCEDYLRDHCPYKVGQKIKIKGFAYNGEDGIIDNIETAIKHYGEITYIVDGCVLNANGKKELIFFRFTEDEERLYEAEKRRE